MLVMCDSPERKSILFHSIQCQIRFNSIWYSQSAQWCSHCGHRGCLVIPKNSGWGVQHPKISFYLV